MTDRRAHRGAHPQDAKLFAAARLPMLRRAVAETSWLLSRGYALRAGLNLVGNHYQLAQRQRLAVMRAACSDRQRRARLGQCVEVRAMAGQRALIDGYNLLTTVEAALAGGVLLKCRDRCLRDMASMHGSYRKVAETAAALEAIAGVLERAPVGEAVMLLDAPVSNSGRLKTLIDRLSRDRGWSLSAVVEANPDGVLKRSGELIVTADSGILDAGARYVNLAAEVVASLGGAVWLMDLDATVDGA